VSALIRARPAIADAGVAPLVPATTKSGRPGRLRIPAHERLVLANGVSVTIVPLREVPLVAFCAVLRGGARGDSRGKSGLAALVAGLFAKGAGERSGFAFADALEGAGGSFNATAAADHILVSGQFLARDQALMLALLADALLAPHFAPAQLEKLRNRYIELLKAAKDSDPAELLGSYGRAFLFHGHPYGRPVTGSESSLASMTQRDALEYYRTQVGADRLALVFAGDVQVGWLKKTAARAFGAWRPAAAALEPIPVPRRVRKRRVLLIDAPGATQSYFWIGANGVDRLYPRRAALDLVNALLGGRFTSLLNTELRIRSGLSYGAASAFTRGVVPAEFAIRSFAQSEHMVQALDLTLATLSRLKREGISAEMLESARAYLLGQYPLAFETASDWAAAFGELEAYGLTPQYLEGYGVALRDATLADAREVIAEAFPAPEHTVIVLIGAAAKIGARLSQYGSVTEMTLSHPSFRPPRAAARRPLTRATAATRVRSAK